MGSTPYLLAARSADIELMRLLKQLGADPTIPNADGSTAFLAAAGLGTRSPGEDAGTEEEVVEALQVCLDHGLDINAVDKNGETTMHGAAYKNYPAAVQFLAAHGAKIEVWNKPNKFGWTPMTIAEGYRFGNFKPSPTTVAALKKLYDQAGIKPEPYTPPAGKYYQ
jgi:ankyrin repeat protein